MEENRPTCGSLSCGCDDKELSESYLPDRYVICQTDQCILLYLASMQCDSDDATTGIFRNFQRSELGNVEATFDFLERARQ